MADMPKMQEHFSAAPTANLALRRASSAPVFTPPKTAYVLAREGENLDDF